MNKTFSTFQDPFDAILKSKRTAIRATKRHTTPKPRIEIVRNMASTPERFWLCRLRSRHELAELRGCKGRRSLLALVGFGRVGHIGVNAIFHDLALSNEGGTPQDVHWQGEYRRLVFSAAIRLLVNTRREMPYRI